MEQVPLASVQDPRLVLPTVNATEPVGVPLLAVTAVLSVTLLPRVEAEGLAVTAVVVAALTVPVTLRLTGDDTDAANPVAPP
jgi:hypothetical protein